MQDELTPIPWEGNEESYEAGKADQELRDALERFLERREADPVLKQATWELMALIARRDDMAANRIKQAGLVIKRLETEIQKWHQEALDNHRDEL